MGTGYVKMTPDALGKMLGNLIVEHASIRTGLTGLQTIVLKVTDPKIPDGEDVDVEYKVNPNGSMEVKWYPKSVLPVGSLR